MAKIFLDDYRSPDASMKSFNVVRTYVECILLLQIFRDDIEFIDLDYNLGTKETGLDVLVFMFENGIHPQAINIHSDNIEGIPQMRKYAETHFPEARVTVVQVPAKVK